MGCNPKAGRAPAVRPHTVRTFTDAELVNGMTVRQRLDEAIPTKDAHGRYLHLIGLEIEVDVVFATTAATMPDAYRGEDLYGLISNLQLRAKGRELFRPGTDGRTVRDLQILRNGGVPMVVDPVDLADADATPSRTVKLFIPLGPLGKETWFDRAREGCILMSAFDADSGKADVLSFTLAATAPGIPTGVVVTDYDAMVIRAWTLADEHPILAPLQYVQEEAFPTSSPTLRRHHENEEGVFEHVVVRHRSEDAGADVAITLHANCHAEAGGDTLYSGETGTEVQEAFTGLWRRGDQLLHGLDIQEFIPIILSPPGAKVSDMGDGPVMFRSVRTTHNTTRILAVELTGVSAAWEKAVLEGAGVDYGSRVAKQPTVSKALKHITAGMVPNKVVKA